MIIRQGYNYVYWRCYDLISLTGNYDLGWGASHFMTAILCLVLVNIYSTFNLYNVFILTETSAIFSIGFLFLELINYLLFVRHEKYLEITSLYKEENQRNKYVGRILLVVTIAYSTYSIF